MKDDVQLSDEAQPDVKPRSGIWAVLACLVAIVMLGAIAWRLLGEDNATHLLPPMYLKNGMEVVCGGTESGDLTCANIQTGEVKTVVVPESLRSSSIVPSPNGERLLIQTRAGEFVVTGLDFNEQAVLFRTGEFAGSITDFTWAGNDKLLIRELKREDNDSLDLPEPVVVTLLNIDIGESRRVYKTGEYIDAESVRVIGASDEYVFVTLRAAKNWVAKETDQPLDIMNAIRLSDGFVQQVNTYQVDVTGESRRPVKFREIQYDYGLDKFLVRASETGHPEDSVYMVAQLENNEFGLSLWKLKELPTGHPTIDGIVLSTKGVLEMSFGETSEDANYWFTDDNGSRTGVSMRGAAVEFSVARMPAPESAE